MLRQKLNCFIFVFWVSISLGIFTPSRAFAGYDYHFDAPEVKMGQFESEMSSKMTRGLSNILYGWTELFRTPVEWAQPIERGFVSAVIIGIPYGISRMIGRTLVGVYEVTTFYAPQKPIFREIQGDVA